ELAWMREVRQSFVRRQPGLPGERVEVFRQIGMEPAAGPPPGGTVRARRDRRRGGGLGFRLWGPGPTNPPSSKEGR
ncbi:MAG TPA: hypothetical protein VEF71_23985, partial [Streptosporangiaceae bacterium]|nr:hypothetical protein [Streptosporangiaceae bacterium]